MTVRRALVTGAAGGIGRAVVDDLSAAGHLVFAVDRDGEMLAELEENGVRTIVADITSADERQRVADAVGELDYLVNAAGVIEVEPLSEASEASWEKMFSVNAAAVFFLTQRVMANIRPRGAIVNVASAVARLPASPEVAAYAASKAAVLSFTRSFALELAPRHIRVNALCPGAVATAMQETVLRGRALAARTDVDQVRNERRALIPLGRLAEACECSRVIGFLLSDDADYITGQAVDLSGGLGMLP